MKERTVYQELIEFAIETEKLSSVFYEKLARRFSQKEEISNLFFGLSREEQEHQAELDKLYREFKSAVGSNELERKGALKVISRSEFFMGKDGIYIKYDDIHSLKEALERALQLEQKTCEYYAEIKTLVGHEGDFGSIVLDTIIDMERRHIERISSCIDSLDER